MFSLFKRKSAEPAEVTFKRRVEAFWTWYSSVAERFYQTIEAGRCASLASEVSANVNHHLGNFAWVFGPGANGKGHSFTLTAEGDPHRQWLTRYWHQRAPQLPGWTFYPARQPGPLGAITLDASDKKFNPLEFWLTPHVNTQGEKIDLTVWHPQFDQMPEKQRWFVLFLFLDEALGEYGTQRWIGEIKLNNQRLAQAMPLAELLNYVQREQKNQDWQCRPPGEAGVVYDLKERHDRFLRGDTIAGSTLHGRIVFDYLNAEGKPADPLAGTGADFVYVALDAELLPSGEQTSARGTIEEAIDDALRPVGSGQALGGAHGEIFAYIDLLVFDGPRSIELVRDTLRHQRLPAGTSINYFAKDKQARRVVL